MTGKPGLPALIVRGAIDDLAAIRELAGEAVVVREIAGGAAARLERALEELDPDPETQVCRDCGEEFPYDPDADFCPRCVAENAGEQPPRCTCEWADDRGDPEVGPDPYIARLDPDCPDPEHREAAAEEGYQAFADRYGADVGGEGDDA